MVTYFLWRLVYPLSPFWISTFDFVVYPLTEQTSFSSNKLIWKRNKNPKQRGNDFTTLQKRPKIQQKVFKRYSKLKKLITYSKHFNDILDTFFRPSSSLKTWTRKKMRSLFTGIYIHRSRDFHIVISIQNMKKCVLLTYIANVENKLLFFKI